MNGGDEKARFIWFLEGLALSSDRPLSPLASEARPLGPWTSADPVAWFPSQTGPLCIKSLAFIPRVDMLTSRFRRC